LICEICGSEVPRVKPVAIEGTILRVCDECSRFGREVEGVTARPGKIHDISKRLELRKRRMRIKDVYEGEGEEVLTYDYPRRIREARTLRGWKQEELAKRINERWSVINKLETGDIRPDDKLVEKLERTLNIRLKEKVENVPVRAAKDRKPLTLGDLIRKGKE